MGRIEESTSFLKKRSKRLLFLRCSHFRGTGPDLSAGAGIKVFLLRAGRAAAFLQKKKSLVSLCLAALPATAISEGIDLSHGGPVTVTALGGIDWDQKNQTVTAHEQARAVRGDTTVDADVLIAHYRKKATPPPKPGDPPPKPTPVSATPNTTPGGPDDTGSNEIYRLNAEGHVHMFTPTDQAWGDHAVYDIDQAVLVLTGHGLRLTTPNDVLTARDSLEYFSAKHMAVARGDATANSNDGRRIVGDTLVGYTVDPYAPPPAKGEAPKPALAKPKAAGSDSDQPGKLQRVEAYGHVILTTPTEIVTGDRGVYIPDTGLARVVGHVHVTRGENQLNGAAAIVNMKTGIATMTQAPGRRVQGLVVPNGSGGGSSGTPGADSDAGKAANKTPPKKEAPQ
jgi:lipopolysaccharide export system protein LptA